MRGDAPNMPPVCSRALLSAALILACVAPTHAITPAGTEIVNVATSSYASSLGGGGPGDRVEVDSNPAITRVTGDHCFGDPTLEVVPTGTVAPGAELVYRLLVENGNGVPLHDVVVELPLHPGLLEPGEGTDGSAPKVGGGQVPCTMSYDPLTHTVRWELEGLDVDDAVTLNLAVRTRPDLPADTLIAQHGEIHSADCPEPVSTNETLTPVVPPLLEITKRADRSTATVGDGVVYLFEIRHSGIEPDLSQTFLVDELPPELRFAPGSARIDGAAVADPEIGPRGRLLRLPLGPLSPGETRFVQLAAIVVPGARRGEAVNHAYAEALTGGGSPIVSNPGTASVTIVPGPFRREAYLVGRVFIDDDDDRLPDADEPGVPGVLVTLENGRGAITDVTGRWHIAGVRPGLHVARIDLDTLPESLVPLESGAEWAGNRLTRFIEARAGTVVVADMPLGPPGSPRCTVSAGDLSLGLPVASLLGVGGATTARTEDLLGSATRWLVEVGSGRPAAPEIACPAEVAGDSGAALRKGLNDEFRRSLAALKVGAGDAGEVEDAEPDAQKASPGRLERILRSEEPRPAILAPLDGARADRARIEVEVIHPLGYEPRLWVNGRPVDPGRLGLSAELESRRIAAARFVGVALEEGLNRIEFRAVPPGADPATARPVQISVTLPGHPVELRLIPPDGPWVADGVTSPRLRVEAVDGAGTRTLAKRIVTLDVEGAIPLTDDLKPDEEGLQVRLRDGAAELRFAPLTLPGRVRLSAWADRMTVVESVVEVRPGGGSWRVLGLAEGRWAGDAGVEGDGGMAPGLDDGISESGGRVAVFARGPVGRSSRLTVSLDTDRERDRDRLTRDFEPDLFFPVSGDSSVQTDEAASQGKLFARLDGPKGFAQWGDFATGFDRTELMRYDRRMTGASGRFTRGNVSVEGFASSSDQEIVRDVFEADGTSGPFLLGHTPVVARSETVIVEVRDRYRTEEVLSRQVRRRDLDYTLDPVAGTLLFRGPVPAFDPRLNPVRVIVLYESRSGGEDQITGGARVAFQPSNRVEVGASAVYDQREGEDLQLLGVDLAWRPRPGTLVEGEVASSNEQNSSTAVRLEVRSQPGPKLGWELAYRDLPAEYDNPSYLGSPELGSRRYGGKLLWQPDPDWRVAAEAFVQDDGNVGLERTVAGVDVERRVGGLTAMGGLKTVSSSSEALGEARSNLLKAGLRGQLARRWTAELVREQALGGETAPGYPTRTHAGISFQLREGMRIFLREELESGDGPDRDRTLLGVESRIGESTRALFNYSLEGTATGTALRALSGVETVLPLGPRSSANFSAAKLHTTRGDDQVDYTTLAGGYEFRAGSHLLSGRYELRLGQIDTRHLLTASGAFRPQEDWSFYVRERLFVTDPEAADRSWRAEGLLGAAYRPLAGPWRFLARLDHSTSGGTAATAGGVAPGSGFGEPTVGNGLGFGPGRGLLERDALSLGLAGGARLTARQRLAASLTLRRVDDDDQAGLPSTLASLVSLHYTAQVHRRWTLGGSLRRFSERETGTTTYGQGVELGYLVLRNLWVTGGYNFTGFEDDHFPGADHTESGPFLSLRFKFDEKSLTQWRDLRLDR